MTVPSVSAHEMREVDRIMTEELGVGLLQMMELAGRNLAEAARRMLGGDLTRRSIIVLAGPGNNGGGGLAGARHCANAGAAVVAVTSCSSERLRDVAARQHATLRRMSVPTVGAGEGDERDALARLEDCDLVIDALLGYSVDGPPRGPVAELITRANAGGRPILALDLPSGLDPDSGEALAPCVRAEATLTLALPKRGLLAPGAQPYVGTLWVGDIGVPPSVWERFGLSVGALFARAPVVEVR
ncbi:MAG: NAD(P)H-hydrate epimerase [Candidatus Rokubacteria bacterium RIFCSPLOWO2_12_FULL_71_22]|nr:MAG: NAD(P)H-hydrate epimerase [Candidatus Rokubacteria bacterium RIFCSPLOWO2_12_FULL_71_22]